MPSPERCRENGVAEFAHVPVIFSKDWRLHGVAVDYLLAKARGSWVTTVTVVTSPPSDYAVRKKKASANTLKAVGEDLTNFLDWCEARNADWRTVSYEQLEKRLYVGDMIAGQMEQAEQGHYTSTLDDKPTPSLCVRFPVLRRQEWAA